MNSEKSTKARNEAAERAAQAAIRAARESIRGYMNSLRAELNKPRPRFTMSLQHWRAHKRQLRDALRRAGQIGSRHAVRIRDLESLNLLCGGPGVKGQ